MATWQFDLFVIPRTAATTPSGHLRLTSLELDREKIVNLESFTISDESLRELCEGLAIVEGWKGVTLWGDPEGNRFDILKVDGRTEIFFRIDVRNINLIFLSKITTFARANNLVILTSADQILEPSVRFLMKTIERSSAFKFVLDPKDFLKKLDQNPASED
jgi:hypothetical protein